MKIFYAIKRFDIAECKTYYFAGNLLGSAAAYRWTPHINKAHPMDLANVQNIYKKMIPIFYKYSHQSGDNSYRDKSKKLSKNIVYIVKIVVTSVGIKLTKKDKYDFLEKL